MVVCLTLSPCSAKGLNFYSFDREVALGKRLAGEIERHATVIRDPMVSEYVNRLAQSLGQHSAAKVPFTVEVLDAGEVNALALPGGFFFVNSGLILETDSEAQLAAVMAHEIAHVAARHGTRMATRSALAHYAILPLILAGGWGAYALYQGASAAIPIGLFKFSRGFETQADMLGLQYMYEAGYDPAALVDFFEDLATLEKKRPGVFSRLFATHPMTEDRIQAARKKIQSLPARPEYVWNTSEFMDVKARLARLEDRPVSDRPTLKRRN